MLNKLIMTAIAMSMSASLCALNFDAPANNNFKEMISNLEVNAPAPAAATLDGNAVKEWTIMVFVNGKNNLEKYAMLDMNEMEMVGSSDKVNIVTEVGRIAGQDSSDGDWVGSRRYLVQKDNNTSAITSPVVQDLGKVDMGDYNHVIEFGKWAKANYPAKKYMLILWNHGAGWVKSRAEETKGISYDDETGHHINTPQLGLVLQGIGGVDVYGSDACLMQMPEVNYEIKPYVEYIVGSEETEPGDGYTYNTFLGPIVSNPAMTSEEVGKQAVTAYMEHYAGQGATQSLVKASAMDGFVGLVNDFVAAAMASGEKALVKSALSKAQKYAYADNKDMWHFLSLYAASSASQDVKTKAANLQNYLTGTLVVHNMASGSYSGKSLGLAVYLPASSFNSAYNELAWAKAAQWDEFINWYLAKDEVVVADATGGGGGSW
jgi:hypothetical protein